jgi:hypothetical protein
MGMCLSSLDNAGSNIGTHLRRSDTGDYHLNKYKYKLAASSLHTRLGVFTSGFSLFVSLLMTDHEGWQKYLIIYPAGVPIGQKKWRTPSALGIAYLYFASFLNPRGGRHLSFPNPFFEQVFVGFACNR